MEFIKIRDSVRSLLAQNADGEFNVIGAQKSGKGAPEVADRGRLVEVYYSSGEFPKSGAGILGPTKHEITFRIDLTVSKSAKANKADIDTINNPGSTATEVARAIARIRESELMADESLDELFARVYQIIMDARNLDLGLDVGEAASRWVSRLSKDEPVERGNYTILTGSMILTCTASEPVYGYVGVEAGNIMDVGVEVETDIPAKAGVQTGA